MKRNVLIAILITLATLGTAVGVHLVNDKVWQCERFLSKYQRELEEIAEFTMKTGNDLCLQKDNYEEASFPAPVKEAMKTYFINVHHGSINVIQKGPFEMTSVSFDITDKAYEDDIESIAYEWFSLYYTHLDADGLRNRLAEMEEVFSVFPAEKQGWYIVASCHE